MGAYFARVQELRRGRGGRTVRSTFQTPRVGVCHVGVRAHAGPTGVAIKASGCVNNSVNVTTSFGVCVNNVRDVTNLAREDVPLPRVALTGRVRGETPGRPAPPTHPRHLPGSRSGLCRGSLRCSSRARETSATPHPGDLLRREGFSTPWGLRRPPHSSTWGGRDPNTRIDYAVLCLLPAGKVRFWGSLRSSTSTPGSLDVCRSEPGSRT